MDDTETISIIFSLFGTGNQLLDFPRKVNNFPPKVKALDMGESTLSTINVYIKPDSMYLRGYYRS